MIETTQKLEAYDRWVPTNELLKELPSNFSIEMECWRRRDGLRYWIPRRGSEVGIRQGFIAGLAILSNHQNFGPLERYSYRLMFFMWQYVRRMQERLQRRFQYARDLFLRSQSRQSEDVDSILPVGLSLGDPNIPLTVSRFLQQGKELARDFGLAKPSTVEQIQFALFEAAKHQPLNCPEDQISSLVRNALYWNEPTTDQVLDEETRRALEERLCDAFNPHLDDDTAAFNKWFLSAGNSLVKQLAQKRTASGGVFPSSTVRAFLLEMGWNAYKYVGQCLEFWSAAFCSGSTLTSAERQLFERLYYRQAVFGDLPSLLVLDRFPAIQLPLFQFLNDQEDKHTVPALHRLLSNYTEMVENRRTADRQATRRSRHRRKFGSAADVAWDNWMSE